MVTWTMTSLGPKRSRSWPPKSSMLHIAKTVRDTRLVEIDNLQKTNIVSAVVTWPMMSRDPSGDSLILEFVLGIRMLTRGLNVTGRPMVRQSDRYLVPQNAFLLLMITWTKKTSKMTVVAFCWRILGRRATQKNLELDINIAKNRQFRVFRGKQQIPQQTETSSAWRENPRAAEYCCPWW